MTKEQFDKLEKAINSNAARHKGGYLCVGKGSIKGPLTEKFGMERRDLFSNELRSMESPNVGSGPSWDYYIKQDYFNKTRLLFSPLTLDEEIQRLQNELNNLLAEKQRAEEEKRKAKEAAEQAAKEEKEFNQKRIECNEAAKKVQGFAKLLCHETPGVFMQVRSGGKYQNKGFFLGEDGQWEIKRDNYGADVLVPKDINK